MSPSPLGEGPEEGAMPPPHNFFDFWSPNSDFWCIVGAIFTVQWTVLDADSRCMTVIACATSLYSQKYNIG